MKVKINSDVKTASELKSGDMFIDREGDLNIVVEASCGGDELVTVCLGNASGETPWIRTGSPEYRAEGGHILTHGTAVTLVAE